MAGFVIGMLYAWFNAWRQALKMIQTASSSVLLESTTVSPQEEQQKNSEEPQLVAA